MILLPVIPTMGTAGAVCTTAMVLAVPTAGLTSMAMLCAQVAPGMSAWLGWMGTSQGRLGVVLPQTLPLTRL